MNTLSRIQVLNKIRRYGVDLKQLIYSIHHERSRIPSFESISITLNKFLEFKLITIKKSFFLRKTLYCLVPQINDELLKIQRQYPDFDEDFSEYYEGQEECQKFLSELNLEKIVKEKVNHSLDQKNYGEIVLEIERNINEVKNRNI